MNEPIRIGIVGAGAIVRDRHLPNLSAIDGVEIAAVCNSTPESSEAFAREHGVPAVYEDWLDLTQDEEIDVVWIGTWPYMHHTVTMAALAAEKHVFCQARMAMNAKEAREMLEHAQASECVTMLCPPPMGLKGDYFMLKMIREGYLGDLYSIHLTAMNASAIDPAEPVHWRQREDLSGVNALTVGIYAEVIHRWFGYCRDVAAQAKTFIPRRPAGDGQPEYVSRPDVVVSIHEMLNGAILRCEWSGLAAPAPASDLKVYGSQGALCYSFDTDEIFGSQNGGEWEKLDIPDNLVREWTVERDFIDAIRTGKKVHPDFHDGLKYMEFTEALFESARTGQRVTISR